MGHSDYLVLVTDAGACSLTISVSLEAVLPDRIQDGTVLLLAMHEERAERPRGFANRPESLQGVQVLNVRRGHAGDLSRASPDCCRAAASGWCSVGEDHGVSPISE